MRWRHDVSEIWQIVVSLGPVFVLACMLSCGQKEVGDNFVSVTAKQAWGPCYSADHCWRTIGVSRDELTLADVEGRERFSLIHSEVTSVSTVVDSNVFAELIDQGGVADCPPVFDGSLDWLIETRAAGTTSVKGALGCASIEGHPYRSLFLAMVALKVAKSGCAAFTYPTGYVVGVSEPPVRPLCIACAGRC